jgi:putative ABC transport system substrate-binding protein
MNKRRRVIVSLGASVLTAPLAAFGQQQAKVPRIGLLIAETLSGQASRIKAFHTGLRDLGYVEGKNVVIESRPANGDYDRLPELAAELARLKVDVLVAFGAKAVVAARGATSTIPIVVPLIGDPIALGLTSSLARPSGNITGSSVFGQEIAAKRIELLKETVTRITRVAVLLNPANGANGSNLRVMRATGKALKMELHPFEAGSPKDLASAFAAVAKERTEAIVVSQDTLFIANAKEIAALAAKHRIPSAGNTEFAEAGGMIGYGANDAELYRRGAYFVDRIIKGANAADLPFERATRFEMVVNMKTAKSLGIKIPNSIMVRADRVIE